MRKVEVAQAIAPLAEYVKNLKQEPVILIDNGQPIAALVSMENADLETATLSTNPRFLALVERSRASLKSKGGISSQEMRRRLRLERTA